MLATVIDGNDPAAQRAADRAAMTIAELCDEYFDKAERGLIITRRRKVKKASTLYTDRGRIERHIKPLIGRRTVKDLTSRDVKDFLQKVMAGKSAADVKTKKHGRAIVKGGRGTATRTLGLLGGILTYAVDAGYRSDNAATRVVRPVDGKRKVHLTIEQYRLSASSWMQRSTTEPAGKRLPQSSSSRLPVAAAARSRSCDGSRLTRRVIACAFAITRQTKLAVFAQLAERPLNC